MCVCMLGKRQPIFLFVVRICITSPSLPPFSASDPPLPSSSLPPPSQVFSSVQVATIVLRRNRVFGGHAARIEVTNGGGGVIEGNEVCDNHFVLLLELPPHYQVGEEGARLWFILNRGQLSCCNY